ncbi:MAG TPA: sulfatase-like hydrolase/transferase [Pirellulales bacterium]|nr:sulfatase-like hydrolase/transferase [Pirellulales bacterium]
MNVSRTLLRRAGLAPPLVGLALALLTSGAPAAMAEEPKRPPNFLVLVADDLGWNDIGYHGSEVRTPHLDRLAREGVRLERHYVYPICSPTRAGLLTGRNPCRFGIHDAIDPRSTESLPLETLTLARLLKTRGYATAMCGKWHLTLRPEVGPRRFGFDRTYGYLHGQVDPLTHRYKTGARTWHRDDEFVDEPGHATDLIAAEAVRFLSEPRQGPFFLYVAFSVPHYPLAEDEQWLAPYHNSIKDASRRLFAASVTHMDAAVGKIVETLEKTGQIDDTLVLFTSDNGGQRNWDRASAKSQYDGRHGPYATLGDNRPLRGWKVELYEGGVRVPAFVHWRGALKPAVVEETVSYLDWFPTLARLAGARREAAWKLEGRDVWPLLTGVGEKPAGPTLYWDIGAASALLDGDWKLILSRGRSESIELYHLADDPQEKNDLADTHPEKVEQLRGMLARQKDGDP